MEIPFYTSFKEFKDNYKTDLEKWLSIYPDGNEDEFLKDVKDLYEPFLRWSGRYFFKDLEQLQNRVITYDNNDGYTIIFTDDYKIYLTANQFKNLKFALPKIVAYIDGVTQLRKTLKHVNLLDTGEASIGTAILTSTEASKIKIRLKRDLPYNLSDEVTPTAEEQHTTTEEHEKITINGSIQLIGYIFTELIEKGYIEPKRKSGKTNASATAEMLLNHFNFTYNANGTQPSKEYLKKALFEQNQLSSDKSTLIKIPHLKKLID